MVDINFLIVINSIGMISLSLIIIVINFIEYYLIIIIIITIIIIIIIDYDDTKYFD